MPARPQVALIIESSLLYGRRLLRGINRYLRSHDPWLISFEQRDLRSEPPDWLKDWHGDGVITRLMNKQFADILLASRCAVIDLNDTLPAIPGLSRMWADHVAIGRIGAEHFIERGFRNLAFCGFSDHEWSRRRLVAFQNAVEQAGLECHVYESPWDPPHALSWEEECDRMGRWIAELPRPVGLMACSDQRAQHALTACNTVDAAVPEEIAVLGVDDDDVLCNLCSPPLSSIVPNADLLGYEAAATLARMMRGESPPETETLIAPIGIQTRQSTDVLAIDQPSVAAALSYIREHACQGITVSDVLTRTSISRSMLERLFRKHLGHSPQARIRSVQLKRVKQLLVETELPLERIASLSGYRHAEYMSVVFKREVGVTPGHYRRQVQASD